ncbi:Uncharacterized protein ESCO_000207 [Escovopsis weberi]|uniref:Steroid 5-alpha reductase C-terminal domain-containing protein n=1 Tax=Escovopsis weberi TaxID=150374 RepID=A0A0M8MXE8_ESCWE|nr:Uncharacterized protein ESCO_000207 [Escovopsis weberi]
MALPPLKTLQDCADYYHVVEPFIPQLYELPNRVLASIASPHDLKLLYLETNPLVTGTAASVVVGLLAWILSELNKNYSQIDRVWSILPNLYAIHMAVWARLSGLSHTRPDMVAVATTMWSIRLTYNYYRKGGYQVGSEDYRWEIAKKNVPGFVWFIFNFTFISFIQSFLLCLLSAGPAYVILLSSQKEPQIKPTDFLYFSIQILLVWSEWITDGQQWDYQTAKQRYRKDGVVGNGFTKADLERGFITKGVWAYSRHPNFFAEQTFWFVLYNWSCYASESAYSWAGAGAAALILLFQGSTLLTESITGGKYPEYADYQREVGMFIPISFIGYKPPVRQPKIIRTSELAKRQEEKQRKEQNQ